MAHRQSFRTAEGTDAPVISKSSVTQSRKGRQTQVELELYRGLMWHKGPLKRARQYDKRATSFASDGSSSTEESMLRDEAAEAGWCIRLKRKFTISSLEGRGYQIYSALMCSLGAFAVGSHMGWASSVIEKNNPKGHTGRFDLKETEVSQIMSALPVGMILAAPPTCVILDFLGRHAVLLISAAPLMAAWIQVLVATSPYTILMSRLVAGFGSGMVLTTMPIYLSEIAETKARGTIVMLFPLMLSAGMLTAYVLVAFVEYPADIAILMIVPVVFFTLYIFAAESPVYLCLRECWSTAYNLLKKLRVKEDLQFEIEYEDKMVSTDISRQETFGFKNLCINNHIKRLFFLITILFSVQQLSGIFTIFAFHQDILKDAKTPLNSTIVALCLASVQLGANLVAMVFVDILGRRPLLLFSLFGSAVSLGLLGLLFSFYESKFGLPQRIVAWGVFGLLLSFVAVYSVGIGPLPWVLLGELTLPGVRGASAGAALITAGLSGIVSSKFFQDVQGTWGYATSFWSFSLVCTVGALFVGYLIPETKQSFIVDIHRTMYNIDDASITEPSSDEEPMNMVTERKRP